MGFNILAIGTSVMWGQGLREEQKIHAQVTQALQSKTSEIINSYLLAHSGAILGFKEDGTEDTTKLPRIHGEVPTFYPTILQQLEEFDDLGQQMGAPEDVHVVIVEGGINDVNILRILDPLTTHRSLKRAIEIYCHRNMKLLLERVAAKFPNAILIVPTYYPMLNEHSEDEFLSELLYAVGAVPGGLIADFPIHAIANLAKRRVLANCDQFYRQSREALKSAVDEVNAEIGAGKSPRAFLATPHFPEKNTAFSADPWLFAINPDMTPQDHVVEERCDACEEAGYARTIVPVCRRASNGHPNEKGAKAYAEAIIEVLLKSLPDHAKSALNPEAKAQS